MKYLSPILLLLIANVFMTLAWYGHLKFKEYSWGQSLNLFHMILISWGIAFFEYCIQVPANRLGFIGTNGPYTLVQLKIIQEVITLIVFFIFAFLLFRQETFKFNHFLSAIFLVCADYFAFKK